MAIEKAFVQYLPVNDQALLWELYAKDAGCTNIRPGSNYPPVPSKHPKGYTEKVKTGRILREFQVVYISSGSGWFKNSYIGKTEIKAGDIFIIFPEVLHSYSPHIETGWQEYWVGFSGDHAYRLKRNGLFSPRRPIQHIGLDSSIVTDFEQIIQLCSQQPSGFQVILGAKILQLLAHIHVTENNQRTSNTVDDIISKVRNIMEFYIEDGINIENIATQVNVSYQYLLKIFKQQTGFTPYQYYLSLRISRAQELLLHTELSIKEVAAQLKFENQYYFSRIFKKKTGISPSQWKKVEDTHIRKIQR